MINSLSWRASFARRTTFHLVIASFLCVAICLDSVIVRLFCAAIFHYLVIASLCCVAICFWIVIIGDLRSVRRPDSSVESGLGLLLPYCRIEKRNPAYKLRAGGSLPPQSSAYASEVVIASFCCACAREAGYSDLPFVCISWRPSVRSRARSGDRQDHSRHRERSVTVPRMDAI